MWNGDLGSDEGGRGSKVVLTQGRDTDRSEGAVLALLQLVGEGVRRSTGDHCRRAAVVAVHLRRRDGSGREGPGRTWGGVVHISVGLLAANSDGRGRSGGCRGNGSV